VFPYQTFFNNERKKQVPRLSDTRGHVGGRQILALCALEWAWQTFLNQSIGIRAQYILAKIVGATGGVGVKVGVGIFFLLNR